MQRKWSWCWTLIPRARRVSGESSNVATPMVCLSFSPPTTTSASETTCVGRNTILPHFRTVKQKSRRSKGLSVTTKKTRGHGRTWMKVEPTCSPESTIRLRSTSYHTNTGSAEGASALSYEVYSNTSESRVDQTGGKGVWAITHSNDNISELDYDWELISDS